MAIQYRQQSSHGNIGAPYAYTVDAYDDGALPLNAAQITAVSAALSGLVTVAIVSGQAVVTIDLTTVAKGDYFYVLRVSTDGGTTWVTNSGDNTIALDPADTETITIAAGATFTMTHNLPSAGKTKLIINFGDNRSVLDGSASNFVIDTTDAANNNNAIRADVQLNGPGKCFRMGTSTVDAIKVVCQMDTVLKIDQIDFDTCGAACNFARSNFHDGKLLFTNNTVETNTLVPAVSDPFSSSYQIRLFQPIATGANNKGQDSYVRSLITNNRIGKAYLFLNSTSNVTMRDNVMIGDRCGLQSDGVFNWTFSHNYVDTGPHATAWSQVSGVSVTATTVPEEFKDNILRRAEWSIRGWVGGTIDSCVFADQESHNSIETTSGTPIAETVIQSCLFLPSTEDGGNQIAVVTPGSTQLQVKHCTVAFAKSVEPHLPFLAIPVGVAPIDLVQDTLFTGMRITRGVAVAGDAVIAPDASEALSGSPLRPASTPNRVATMDHNGYTDNASADDDAFDIYGVGTTVGTLGLGDVNADPQYLIGYYVWPSDTDVWARNRTIAQMLFDVRYAFSLKHASPMRNAASDGTHIGAVQFFAGDIFHYPGEV